MPNDPRIIPLLDPTPTEEDALLKSAHFFTDYHTAGYSSCLEYAKAQYPTWLEHAVAIRVRIAREAIEWCRGLYYPSVVVGAALEAHDAALRQRDGGQVKERNNG